MTNKTADLIKSNLFKIAIFLFVVAFTFILRAHNYDKNPPMGHLEELLYGWSGINLVETGYPVSWSTLDYPDRAEIFRGKIFSNGGNPFVSVRLYKPWLDEPPLFSLLVGYSAHIFHANRNEVLPTSFIRFPVILFSLLISVFIFLTARLVSGYWTGILAMLFWGITPIMVFASRMAVPENLIALFFIIAVYLLINFIKHPKFRYLFFIPILAGLAGLAKPTGYFILPLAIYVAISKKYYKSCVYMALAIIPFVLAFIWYGNHYDSEIFWKIVSIQGFRPAGFSSLAYFFTTPAFNIVTLTDSWYIFSLLAAAYFLFLPKDGLKRFISFSFAYWLLIVMVSSGENDLLPWYRFPAFPFLAILGAWGIQELVKRADFFASFLTAGILLGGRMLIVNAFRPNITALNYRIVLSSLMIPSIFNEFLNKNFIRQFNRLIIIGIIIVGGYFNSVYIYNEFELDCESQSCSFGPSTFLSTIHFPVVYRLFVLGEPTYR